MKFIILLGCCLLVNAQVTTLSKCASYTPKQGFVVDQLLNTTLVVQAALNIPHDPRMTIPPCTTSFYMKKDGSYYAADRTGRFFKMNFPEGQSVGHVTYNIPVDNSTSKTIVVEQYFIDSDPSFVNYQVWTICIPLSEVTLTYAYVNHPVGKDISSDTMKTIAQNLASAGFDPKTLYPVQFANCTYNN